MGRESGGGGREYTEADFQRLLSLLDDDPVQAPLRYIGVRERLEKLFERHESTRIGAARDADEALDRLILQMKRDESFRPANIFSYLAGIARRMVTESYKRPRTAPFPVEFPGAVGLPEVSEQERQMEWLDHCLEQLPEEDGKLITGYYAGEGRAKVDWRQLAAADLQKSGGAMRVAVFRIRKRLLNCIQSRRRAEGM